MKERFGPNQEVNFDYKEAGKRVITYVIKTNYACDLITETYHCAALKFEYVKKDTNAG